ncbi:MAG: molybdopterin-binding protein [Silicimonas sp.]|nr:molybdopterin-binding protein [Silicimonas sp.]
MRFGPVPLDEASGAVLAHSLNLGDGKLSKGTVLGDAEIARLRAEGIRQVVVARLEADDLAENVAARRIADGLLGAGLKLGPAFTGRVNLIAGRAGVIRVDAARIAALNAIDEGLTLATLPDLMSVAADQLVATVKIIPYGLPSHVVEAGEAALGRGAVVLHPFRGGSARLVMTRTPGFKESLFAKGEEVVRARLEALGYDLREVAVVDHETGAVAAALSGEVDLTLILGASATSDRADVAPASVVAAGGEISRFGMPVDPGNLLFLGEIAGRPVVGLPGCARSPALNGVDWVLERLSAGLPVGPAEIAAMGVGGLLKEMPGRPQPRRPKS